jgi:hypothetical protein
MNEPHEHKLNQYPIQFLQELQKCSTKYKLRVKTRKRSQSYQIHEFIKIMHLSHSTHRID